MEPVTSGSIAAAGVLRIKAIAQSQWAVRIGASHHRYEPPLSHVFGQHYRTPPRRSDKPPRAQASKASSYAAIGIAAKARMVPITPQPEPLRAGLANCRARVSVHGRSSCSSSVGSGNALPHRGLHALCAGRRRRFAPRPLNEARRANSALSWSATTEVNMIHSFWKVGLTVVATAIATLVVER